MQSHPIQPKYRTAFAILNIDGPINNRFNLDIFHPIPGDKINKLVQNNAEKRIAELKFLCEAEVLDEKTSALEIKDIEQARSEIGVSRLQRMEYYKNNSIVEEEYHDPEDVYCMECKKIIFAPTKDNLEAYEAVKLEEKQREARIHAARINYLETMLSDDKQATDNRIKAINTFKECLKKPLPHDQKEIENAKENIRESFREYTKVCERFIKFRKEYYELFFSHPFDRNYWEKIDSPRVFLIRL